MDTPYVKEDIIYTRFSSDLQRTDSNADQERRCRDGLSRLGIADSHFRIIPDEAVSGASEARPGFEEIKQLIRSRRLGLLVVSEQSRLSRGDNAKSIIKDIVFQGGRFISIAEGIDTDRKGWQLLVGFSQLHHSRSNDDAAERVRGGQEGRVLDGNGSAGDYPYGYCSQYVDPIAAKTTTTAVRSLRRKSSSTTPQPLSCGRSTRFGGGESIASIVRWLNTIRDKIPAIGKGNWHHEHVRRILMNPKYMGDWSFGQTTTVRSGDGRKRQVKVRADQKVTRVQRPSLQIIDQKSWDAAQAHIEELRKVYGMKPGGKKRGPGEYYRLMYPKSLLGGIIYCSKCGSRMIVSGGNGIKRLGCPKHRAGTCDMTARVVYAKAEVEVLQIVHDVLTSYPAWLDAVKNFMCLEIHESTARIPKEQEAAKVRLAAVQKEIDNLVAALANGLNSVAVRDRLRRLEIEKADLMPVVSTAAPIVDAEFPDEAWVREQLRNLGELIVAEQPMAIRVVRSMLGKIIAEEVRSIGKTRGYVRLRFRLNGWAALSKVLSERMPESLLAVLKSRDLETSHSDEFIIDLGAPTNMDRWAPEIAKWREEGIPWKEIAKRTGLQLANAFFAFKRYAKGKGNAA